MTREERDWLAGRAAGIKAAEGFDRIRTHSMTAPAGSSPTFASAFRLGQAMIRQRIRIADRAPLYEAHADNGTRPDYLPCPGRFEYAEDLPTGTVLACTNCGQHRVRFHDPEAFGRAMAGLAEYLAEGAVGDA